MVQSWLSPAQQSFIEDVERELKRDGNAIGRELKRECNGAGRCPLLIIDVKTEDWDEKHPYKVIDVHLNVDSDGDVMWDGYMPSDERSYWDNHGYVFGVTIPYSNLGNPIYIGGE